MRNGKRLSSTGSLGLFLAMALSIFFICVTFDFHFILGNSRYWTGDGMDVGQHVSGMAMYLSNPWQFPLLAFDNLNYPQGTRVTFVDGIPIYAVLLKLFLPKSIGFINPLGYWIGLCFLLQGISAWWITKELQIKSWFCLIFLILVFLTFPPLMMRLRQTALMSHWLILFSIVFYLQGHRLQRFSVIGWTFLIFSSFYIHIYLFAMVFGIYIASIFEVKSRFSIYQVFLKLLPLIVLMASLFIFLLPLPPFSLIKEVGFEKYGLSILSPFMGGELIQWQINMTEGQKEEGFPYLGLGVVIAFLYVTFLQKSECKKIIKNHMALFIVMIFYFVYSLSDHIYFQDKLIAIMSYPDFLSFITGELRYAARFFWPLSYAIIIFSACILYRRLSSRAFCFFICILLAIQLADIRGYYQQLKTKVYGHKTHHILDFSALDNFRDKPIKHLYLYPKYKCTLKPFRNNVALSVMRYAAIRHLTVNTGYIARYKPLCNDVKKEIASSNHDQSIYIFMSDEYPNKEAVLDLMETSSNVSCQEINMVYLCKFIT